MNTDKNSNKTSVISLTELTDLLVDVFFADETEEWRKEHKKKTLAHLKKTKKL